MRFIQISRAFAVREITNISSKKLYFWENRPDFTWHLTETMGNMASHVSPMEHHHVSRLDAQELCAQIKRSVDSAFAEIVDDPDFIDVAHDSATGEHHPIRPGTVDELASLLRESDLLTTAADIAALGSPVRLEIISLCTGGPIKVRDLAEKLGKGTTGQVYHHLRQLSVAGWIRPSGKSSYTINEERLDHLLAILRSTAHH